MRIVFDHQAFTAQQFGGISRYVCSLAEELASRAEHQVRVIAPVYVNQHLASLKSSLAVGVHVPVLPRTGRAKELINGVVSRMLTPLYRPDVIHETYYARHATGPRGCPRTATVHDFIHEKFPESFASPEPTCRNKRATLLRADHIFCVSENTRSDLLERFPALASRTSVTTLGLTSLPPPTGPQEPGRPYFLFVGSRHGYKNCRAVWEAFAASSWLRSEFRVVCFGGGPFRSGELSDLHRMGLTGDVITYRQGNDEVLSGLYRHAIALVFPSLYEGFGIPPLEAMSTGCPVICSDCGSIPEVVGSAGEYAPGGDAEALRHAMEHVASSAERRSELRTLGSTQVLGFSWKRCAELTLEQWRRLI